MGTLLIALEDGFDDDHVVVTADDAVLLDQEHVTTRTVIGLAQLTQAEVPADRCRVRISLPERQLDTSLDIQLSYMPNLRVSVTPQGLAADPTDNPLFYA